MDHEEIWFILKDGLEELLNRKIEWLSSDNEYDFNNLMPAEQLELAKQKMYEDINEWSDWESKNAQANMYKLREGLGNGS